MKQLHRNKGLYSTITISFLFFALFFLSVTNAFAHKVSIFAWVENGTINTESYFPDGKVVQNGTISVFDSNKRLLLTGGTDSEGMFSFPVPKRDDLTIILDASMGHRATYRLSQEELGESVTTAAGEEDASPPKTDDVEDIVPETTGPKQMFAAQGDGTITLEDMRRIVREEVSNQLGPISASLNRLHREDRVSIGDVLAGIGYIVGLMGLAMFIYSKRKK